jgi:hypothetical protein
MNTLPSSAEGLPGPEQPTAEEVAAFVVAAAVWAPSVHNTQPWGFSARGQEISLYADASRIGDSLIRATYQQKRTRFLQTRKCLRRPGISDVPAGYQFDTTANTGEALNMSPDIIQRSCTPSFTSAQRGPGHELRVVRKAAKVTAALHDQHGHGDPERAVGGEETSWAVSSRTPRSRGRMFQPGSGAHGEAFGRQVAGQAATGVEATKRGMYYSHGFTR